jgi:hypothetical protein
MCFLGFCGWRSIFSQEIGEPTQFWIKRGPWSMPRDTRQESFTLFKQNIPWLWEPPIIKCLEGPFATAPRIPTLTGLFESFSAQIIPVIGLGLCRGRDGAFIFTRRD